MSPRAIVRPDRESSRMRDDWFLDHHNVPEQLRGLAGQAWECATRSGVAAT